MRTGGTIYTASAMTTTATTKATFSPPPASEQRSAWHSPVPYLFGGLAAMLGLIAFALLILACSYWKLSGRLDNDGEGGDRDVEAGDQNSCETIKAFPVFEERIVVIMAGDTKPTFLATPISSRASSIGDGNGKSEKEGSETAEIAEKPKQAMGNHDQNQMTTTATTEDRETHETHQSQEQNHEEA